MASPVNTDGLLDRLAEEVDVTARSDLARRISAAVERALPRRNDDGDPLLPSTRVIAAQLGVHRATVKAALEQLARRGLIERLENGRYQRRISSPAAKEDTGWPAVLQSAAELAARIGATKHDFVSLAAVAYETASIFSRPVFFAETQNQTPGISANTLALALGVPVGAVSLDSLKCVGTSVVVVSHPDVEEVRALAPVEVRVISVGAGFDVDVKLGLRRIASGSTVTIRGHSAEMSMLVAERVLTLRPDLSTSTHEGSSLETVGLGPILVPEDFEMAGNRAVLRYRYGPGELEIELIKRQVITRGATEIFPTAVQRLDLTEEALDPT